MKKFIQFYIKLLLVLSLVILGHPALAQDDEQDADQEIENQEAEINEAADTEDGQHKIRENLKNEFNVDDQTIQNLRDKKMGYGEISTTLALAERMEGGINDANIKPIVDLRSG